MLSPHPHVRSPLTKHTPYLVDGLRARGCIVETAPWGHRREDESVVAKLVERWRDVLRIRRLVRAQPFDALVVKTSHDSYTLARDIPLVLLTRRHVPSIVLQFHGSAPWLLVRPGHLFLKTASRLLLRITDAALVLSSDEKRQWETFDDRASFFVVENAFLPRASAAGARVRTDTSPNILFVGRLLEQKGVFELVEAVGEVSRDLSCRLTLVGDGPAESALKRRVLELGLADRVAFLGYRRGDDLLTAYETADLFVLPSWREGFPTVISEALSAGLPIVTTTVGGAIDHLVEGEHALFVRPRDAHRLADAIARLLRDPGLRHAMGRANHERVRMFLPERVARRYLGVLEAIAGARTPSSDAPLPVVWPAADLPDEGVQPAPDVERLERGG